MNMATVRCTVTMGADAVVAEMRTLVFVQWATPDKYTLGVLPPPPFLSVPPPPPPPASFGPVCVNN